MSEAYEPTEERMSQYSQFHGLSTHPALEAVKEEEEEKEEDESRF